MKIEKLHIAEQLLSKNRVSQQKKAEKGTDTSDAVDSDAQSKERSLKQHSKRTIEQHHEQEDADEVLLDKVVRKSDGSLSIIA